MKVKVFEFVSERGARNPVTLSVQIESTLSEFAGSNEIKSVSQSVDFQSGPFGKALVIVVYEEKPKESKKEVKKKS